MKTLSIERSSNLIWNWPNIFLSLLGCLVAGLSHAQPEQGSWGDAAPMLTARKEINNAAVVIGNAVYVVGGVASSGSISAVLERYDPSTDSWLRLADLPSPVWRASAAAAAGRLYVFGGYRSLGAFPFSPSDQVWEYDPATDQWQQRANLSSPRGSSLALTMNDQIHLIGGANDQALSLHEIYDPAADSWSTAAALGRARSNPTGVVLDGQLVVAGGYFLQGGVTPIGSIVAFDADANQWTAENQLPSLPLARFGMDAVVQGTTIYFFGGNQNSAAQSRTMFYNRVNGETGLLADMPTGGSFAAAAAVGQAIHVIGGGPVNLNRTDAVAANRVFIPPNSQAEGVMINPGLGGAWFNPATSGQGFFIDVLPDAGVLFVAWFTYEIETGPRDGTATVGEPGHRWITAQGGFSGSRAELTAFVTSGGVFDDAAPVSNTEAGTLVVDFSSCDSGRVEYDFPAVGLSGEIPISRIANDNIALCQALDGVE